MVLAEVIVNVDTLWLTFVIGTILPAAVAFVTKQYASSAWKAWVLVALTVLTAIAQTVLTNGGSFELYETLTTFFMTYVTAITVHLGLLKPAGVTGAEGSISQSVPGGVGTEVDQKSRFESQLAAWKQENTLG